MTTNMNPAYNTLSIALDRVAQPISVEFLVNNDRLIGALAVLGRTNFERGDGLNFAINLDPYVAEQLFAIFSINPGRLVSGLRRALEMPTSTETATLTASSSQQSISLPIGLDNLFSTLGLKLEPPQDNAAASCALNISLEGWMCDELGLQECIALLAAINASMWGNVPALATLNKPAPEVAPEVYTTARSRYKPGTRYKLGDKIWATDKEGNVYGPYATQAAAAQDLGLPQSGVSSSLHNPRVTRKGYKFTCVEPKPIA